MQEISSGVWGLFFSAFISSTIAPGGSEAVLAYMVSEDVYDVQFLVFVAAIGNTLGAMTTWGLGMLAAKKFPVATLLPEKKKERIECSKKKGNLGIVFFMVASDRRCFMFCWRMVEAPFITRLFSHFIR